MKLVARSSRLSRNDLIISLVGGAGIAHFATSLLQFSYLWSILITVGIFTAVLSLTARKFKEYWLAIFVLTLPLEIKKLLIDSEYIREIYQQHGIPLGEIAGPVIYLSDLPFLVLLGVWLFEILCKKQRVFFPKSNWMALGFLAWAALSLFNAQVFSYGFFDLMRAVKLYILYLYIANNVRSINTARVLITCLLLGMIFQGFICFYQSWSQDVSHIFGDLFGKRELYIEEMTEKMKTFFLVGQESDFKRASGTVGAINAEAQYFEFILPFAFLLSLTAADFRYRVFNAIAFLVGLPGLILTFSRGGFVGLTAGMLAAVIFSIAFKTISRRKLMAIIIFGLLTATVFGPKIYEYMMTRPEATLARFRLYKVGFDMIRAHPVVGVGLNNHNVVIREFDPETHVIDMPVHNNYLVIASEVGLPGLAFFLGFLILSCIAALKAARSNNRYKASLAIGILGAYIAISVHNLVDHLDSHTNLTLLWLYAGMAVALARLNASDSERVLQDEDRSH